MSINDIPIIEYASYIDAEVFTNITMYLNDSLTNASLFCTNIASSGVPYFIDIMAYISNCIIMMTIHFMDSSIKFSNFLFGDRHIYFIVYVAYFCYQNSIMLAYNNFEDNYVQIVHFLEDEVTTLKESLLEQQEKINDLKKEITCKEPASFTTINKQRVDELEKYVIKKGGNTNTLVVGGPDKYQWVIQHRPRENGKIDKFYIVPNRRKTLRSRKEVLKYVGLLNQNDEHSDSDSTASGGSNDTT